MAVSLEHSLPDWEPDDILPVEPAAVPREAPPPALLQNQQTIDPDRVLDALGQPGLHPTEDPSQHIPYLPLLDFPLGSVDPELAALVPTKTALRLGFVPWRRTEDTLILAIADRDKIPRIEAACAGLGLRLSYVRTSYAAIHRLYQTTAAQTLSEEANSATPAPLSCRNWSGRRARVAGLLAVLSVTALALSVPDILIQMLFGWILLALLGNTALKMLALGAYATRPDAAPRAPLPVVLPKISVLVPLLKEDDILTRLIRRMDALRYPRDRLEICLVYEENDTTTRSHIEQVRLPFWFRKIGVPESTIQTKPRALNYALDFCTGDIVGIYDAEDAPEPDQLYKVVEKFLSAPADVACAQARLDYYNTDTNWISRCFTIEYSTLFRVILPGLERLGLPIPLGGTSVFFLRDKLEKLGRWDAHNVTEDADLGMRLHRYGYRCAMVDATTYEEANFRVLPWVRQRSRWLKGFLQTWMTHVRRPLRLLRAFGPGGFLAFNILFLCTFTSFAAAPIILPMWLLSFGVDIPLYAHLPAGLLTVLFVTFVSTEVFLLILGATAVVARGTRHLLAMLPAMLLYWPIGAFAAYKAFFELFWAPMYWDKTAHGINDRQYQDEIDRLTAREVG